MASWETWFRTQRVDEVRKSLSLLEAQVNNETSQVYKDVGRLYPDIMVLSERLESLKLLGSNLETHIEQFGTPPPALNLSRDILESSNRTGSALAMNRKIEKILCSQAERSIAQQKYAIAARSLYFLEALGMPQKKEGKSIGRKLTALLEAWMESGTYLSQTMYNACLIHFRQSPARFLEAVLDKRQSLISDLLSSAGSIPEAFKAVDSALFIYNQIISDWGNSRLSQRRITDMAEFSTLPLLREMVNREETYASHIRAYPPECYESSDFPGVEKFVGEACACISKNAAALLAKVPDAPSLIAVMRDVITRVENSLCSSDQGIAEFLDAFEPPFSEVLLSLVKSTDTAADFSNWEERTVSARSGIAQLSKLARSSQPFVPTFSDKMRKLEGEASACLQECTSQAYTQQRTAITDSIDENKDLRQTAQLISSLSKLNVTFKKLGGEPQPIPAGLYEDLAHLLVDSIKSNEKDESDLEDTAESKQCFGDSSLGVVLELQLLMDDVLQSHQWSVAELQTVRNAVAAKLKENSSEELNSELDALLSSSTSSNGRSSLLLEPLLS